MKIAILAVWAIMSIVGFASMYIDKQKAIKGQYRISEKALFMIALFMGGVGSVAGMQVFRHKTKHWYFVVFIPLFAVFNVLVVLRVMGII